MKLVFTDEAKADLLQIGEWIAEDNPARALTFVDELETRCARLTTMPRAYPLVPRHVGSLAAVVLELGARELNWL